VDHRHGHAVPTRARVLDYGTRWPIESVFSDFKTRGFNLEQSHLIYADRLARLILILGLALHWAARSVRDDALNHPLPVEKKPNPPSTTSQQGCAEPHVASFLGSSAGYVAALSCSAFDALTPLL
jgi:hypothetical protein